MQNNRSAPIIFSLLICTFPAMAVYGQVILNGNVTDASSVPVAGVRVVLDSDPPGSSLEALSNRTGTFTFLIERPGHYFVSATASGYFEIKQQGIDLIAGLNLMSIELILKAGPDSSVEVEAGKAPVVESIPFSMALDEEQVLSLPATRSNQLGNVLSVVPGVTKDEGGKLHLNGSAAEQVNWVLDGFNLADPATGQMEVTLSPEAISSVDFYAGRYSTEFGKGSGGTLVLSTKMGTDQFRYHATDFFPGLEISEGLRVGSWRPKVTLSGPLLKNRLWFMNGLDLSYRENFIPELPKGQDISRYWNIGNLLRLQANLTRSNILNISFLVYDLTSPQNSLGPLDPVETTAHLHNRHYFLGARDQIFFASKSILEVGFGAYRSSDQVRPAGDATYQFTPYGRRGNFPVKKIQAGDRDQLIAKFLFPGWNLAGIHQLKLGLDANSSRYSQEATRTAYEYLRNDGTRVNQISFLGSGSFDRTNLETGLFLQDQWTIRSWLAVESGVRWDWDRFLSRGALSPRFSFALMPPRLRNTRFSAGIGLIPSATPLVLFAKDLDQAAVVQEFGLDGITAANGPTIYRFRIDPSPLEIPQTRNFSVSVEQSLPRNITFRVNYLRKQSRQGYSFLPEPFPQFLREQSDLPIDPSTTIYQLLNFRQETYQGLEFSSKVRFRQKYDCFLSYTHSRSYSNVTLDETMEYPWLPAQDPRRFVESAGLVSWDTPNRLISWGFFPVTRNNSLAYLLDWHNGLPFSIFDEAGKMIGNANERRLPCHFMINTYGERKLRWRRHDWLVRLGVENLTNRPNYTLVNNSLLSPDFLHYYGAEPRKFIMRLRWLGKKP